MAATLETLSHKQACSLISFLCVKRVSPLEIYCRLIEVYDDGITRVQHVTEWCTEFVNGRTDIHNDDGTSLSDISVVFTNAQWVEEWILQNEESQFKVYLLCWRHQLHSNHEVEVAVHKVMWMQEPDFDHGRIFKVMPRLGKYINMLGHYFEE
jgi:hypothetical protein